jgi:acetate kinase
MRLLVFNSGSSSLKYCALESGRLLRRGSVSTDDAESAARRVLGEIAEEFSGAWDAVGHRIVHGGPQHRPAVLLDSAMMRELGEFEAWAPLHQRACLDVARSAQETWPEVPMVGVLDTAFHRSMPAHAANYALPAALAATHGIQRYGFHGIAHSSLAAGYARASTRSLADSRLITLQLGSGCSAAAIRYGRSIDTTMGLTPLEGLMMGTRSGDIDPAVVPHLERRLGISSSEVERLLNEQSGLLGVSSRSADMRELLRAERSGDAAAALAIEMFCYRVKKAIGAYLAVLGGADAVVFGGGIGENASEVRARICAEMEWCGLHLDPVANRDAVEMACGDARRIASPEARLDVFVVAVDEESHIVEETLRCLAVDRQAPP